MAITDLDTHLAAMAAGPAPIVVTKQAQAGAEGAGIAQSLWDRGGWPSAGAIPGSLAGTIHNNAAQGAAPYDFSAGFTYYLNSLGATVSTPGLLILFDLLWMNGGITATTTTAQTVNSVTLPSRDMDGATAGKGCELWLAVHTAATTNASAVTNTVASYTRPNGTSGRTATMRSWPATAVAGTMARFELAQNDTGIASVQSLTLGTSYGAGTLSLMIMRRIAEMVIPAAGTPYFNGPMETGLPTIHPASCLMFVFIPTGATAAALTAASLGIAKS